jgi:hypothetical protein
MAITARPPCAHPRPARSAGFDGSIKYCAGDGCEGPCGDETRFANGDCWPASGGAGGAMSASFTCLGGNRTTPAGGGRGGRTAAADSAAAPVARIAVGAIAAWVAAGTLLTAAAIHTRWM